MDNSDMRFKELLFSTWYLILVILVSSWFVSTIVNPSFVLFISIASTLMVLWTAQKRLRGSSDDN